MTDTVVAIDDEAPNLLLIEEFLSAEGYELKCFPGARLALDYLERGGAVSAVLLDRMMPEIDGIGFMRRFRALQQHRQVPVIMQTAAAMPSQVAEGIAAGAYYYLTKPYSREVVQAILSRALSDHAFTRGLQNSAAQTSTAASRIRTVEFCFRTLLEVRDISSFLASLYPDPQVALLGIRELMLNAVEHGNLGLSYADKTALLRGGQWEQEVERRLGLSDNAGKQARARLDRDGGEIVLTIVDMGAGFDWCRFMQIDAARARDPHGRGIAMSRMVSFKDVTYTGCGNTVVCRADL